MLFRLQQTKNFKNLLHLPLLVATIFALAITLTTLSLTSVTHAQDPAPPPTPTPIPSGDKPTSDDNTVGTRTHRPTITIARHHDSVTEGATVYFKMTASSAPSANLNINVSVTQTGAMLTGTIPTIITIAGGDTTAWLILQTNNDAVFETDSNVTATIQTGTGYSRGSDNYQDSILVEDNDEYAPPKNLVLSIEDHDDNDIDVAYTKNKGTIHYYQYQIHWSTNESGTYYVFRTVSDTISPADFNNLTYGYWYKARGRNCTNYSRRNCTGWSAWSDSIHLTNLAAPTSLNLTRNDNNLSITYTPTSSSLHHYQFRLERASSQYGTYTTIQTTSNSASPVGFNNQTRDRWYRAHGRNCRDSARTDCGGWSRTSNLLRIPLSITISLPNPPTGLSLAQEANDDNDLDLSFTQSQSPHYYYFELHRSTTQTGTFTRYRTSSVGTSPADFDNVTLNRYYKARGRNCRTSSRTGCGNWSSWSDTIHAQNILNPPTNLSISVNTSSATNLKVSYTRSESPHKYQFQLYRSTSQGGTYTLRDTRTVTTSAYYQATFNGQSQGFWYKARGRNCTTSTATQCGPWGSYSTPFHFTHPTLTAPTGISIIVTPGNSNQVNITFTTTTTVNNYIYHVTELHQARVNGQFSQFRSSSNFGTVPSPLTARAPQGYWYKARSKACRYITGINPCSNWSTWSNVLAPPNSVHNYTPNPLTQGTTSNIWTVPSGTSNVYMEVYFTNGEDINGTIKVQRLTSSGTVASTYSVSNYNDSKLLPNVRSNVKLRVDVESDTFSSDVPLVTIDFHSGTTFSGPRIASAFIQLENRPNAPTNGSATADATTDTVTLQWSAGNDAAHANPDHYDVAVPDPSDPDNPLYVNNDVDDTTLVIHDARTRPGPGTHAAAIRHCSTTGICSTPLTINFAISSGTSPSVSFQDLSVLRHIVTGRSVNSKIAASNTTPGKTYRINLSIPSTTTAAGFTPTCAFKTKTDSFPGTNTTQFMAFTLSTCNSAPPFALTVQLQERSTPTDPWTTLETKSLQVEVLAPPTIQPEVDFGALAENMTVTRIVNVAGNPKASRLLIKLDEMAGRAHVITVQATRADATVQKVNSINIYTDGTYSMPPAFNFLGDSQAVWTAPSVAVLNRQIVLEVIDPYIGSTSNLVAYKVNLLSPLAAFVEQPTASLTFSTHPLSGSVTDGNITVLLRIQNNTTAALPVPINIECSVSRGTDIIISNRKHGNFQINPKPARPSLNVGTICQGLLPKAGDQVTLLASIPTDNQVSTEISNTLVWPGPIPQSLFHHSKFNLMGGLQITTRDGICTMSFTIPLKGISANPDYNGVSTTEHCAESTGDPLYPGRLQSQGVRP